MKCKSVWSSSAFSSVLKGSAGLLGATLFLLACNKYVTSKNHPEDPILEKVKTWFNDTIVNAERNRLSLPFEQLPKNSLERRMARWGTLLGAADWEHAAVGTTGTRKIIIVPILASKTPFDDKSIEGGRALVFTLNEQQQIGFHLTEVVGKKDVPLRIPIEDIVMRSAVASLTKVNAALSNITASVLTYDRNYHLVSSDAYDAGIRKPYKVVLSNRRAIANPIKMNAMLRTTTCMQCTNWYLVQYTYWEDSGEIVDYSILREWQECSGDLPDPSYGDTFQDPSIDDCTKSATASLESMVANTSSVSTLDQISLTSETATYRMKNYRWKALKSLTWNIYSHEMGTQVKATTAEGFSQWQWKSLEHVRLEINGMPIGGTIEYELISAKPTLGLFNASMEIVMGVKYGTNCLGVPLSRYENYRSSIYFNVND